jgi:hypothetical protein
MDRADQMVPYYPWCRTYEMDQGIYVILLHMAALNSFILFKKSKVFILGCIQKMTDLARRDDGCDSGDYE